MPNKVLNPELPSWQIPAKVISAEPNDANSREQKILVNLQNKIDFFIEINEPNE